MTYVTTFEKGMTIYMENDILRREKSKVQKGKRG